MRRRRLLSLLGAGGVLLPLETALGHPASASVTLLTAPLQLGGNWGGSAPRDAAAVIERMRTACLSRVALLSDRQPDKLRVDDHSSGQPSIWLHSADPTTGWIFVTVNTRDWCNLAYQFGHELGHVLCNSWEADAKPRHPCQWIEEALVEAFSLRGLAILAGDWRRAPPFPNDGAYAKSIQSYRETVLDGYRKIARDQEMAGGFAGWFKAQEAFLDAHEGIDGPRGAVSTMLSLLEADDAMVADLGALNRWPGRSAVRLHDYLNLWEESCAQLNASGRLPIRLRGLLAGV